MSNIKVIGVGLPKTGTTTLKRCLEILGVNHIVGDHVHAMNEWNAEKLILTVRKNPETWFKSVNDWSKFKKGNTVKNQRLWMYGESYPTTEYLWERQYITHNRSMSKLTNCLVVCWERGDGWGELCSFLNVPVPDVEFPHLNKSKI